MESSQQKPQVADLLNEHRESGRMFHAHDVRSFVREAGSGEAVVFIHGMWGASFLYRKVLRELARYGLRGIAFDLPGFGFADRPNSFDYTWSGLGAFAAAAVEALDLDAFHLVIHDIGGPVGLELAARMPQRVRSLTILNTMIDVTTFNPPWSMRPFRRRVVGEIWLRSLNRPAFRALMRLHGISDAAAVSTAELDSLLALLRETDGGRAFLRVMRGAERTRAKQELYRAMAGPDRYPVQVVWARDDPALPMDSYGAQAAKAARTRPIAIPGKHFPQEDHPVEVAGHIATFVRSVPARAMRSDD